MGFQAQKYFFLTYFLRLACSTKQTHFYNICIDLNFRHADGSSSFEIKSCKHFNTVEPFTVRVHSCHALFQFFPVLLSTTELPVFLPSGEWAVVFSFLTPRFSSGYEFDLQVEH